MKNILKVNAGLQNLSCCGKQKTVAPPMVANYVKPEETLRPLQKQD